MNFYEPRTIHDSSLSKAIHGIVAARCGDTQSAYRFWRDGADIDLGCDPHSSDEGIHAAATGAIWSGAVQGFAGLQVLNGELHLSPSLPSQWHCLSFPLQWQQTPLRVTIDSEGVTLDSPAPISLMLWGHRVTTHGRQAWRRSDFNLSVVGTATTDDKP